MNVWFARRALWTVAVRVGLFAALWWVVTEGAPDAWLVGIPAVLLAAMLSIAQVPSVPFVASELLRFVPFFLAHSLRGGADVALRALHPALPIAPTLVDYPLRLPEGLPRVVMLNTLSLLPGTLAVDVVGDCLHVHVLDGQKACLAELQDVEARVARLFGIQLPVVSGVI